MRIGIRLVYLIFLVSLSCSIKSVAVDKRRIVNKDPEIDNIFSELQGKLHKLEVKTLFFFMIRAGKECVERMDEGIEIIKMTEELAKKINRMDVLREDPGFDRWLVTFHDMPGKPPYVLQHRRLLTPLLNRYYLFSKDAFSQRKFGAIVSVKGFLPGEKLTLCACEKQDESVYKEITFYPRPLFLKDKAGKILAKATLRGAEPGHTIYDFDVCGVSETEKYTLTCHFGKEERSQEGEGPRLWMISPEVSGERSGFAKVDLRLGDGSSYSIQLPWGEVLLEYKAGGMPKIT